MIKHSCLVKGNKDNKAIRNRVIEFLTADHPGHRQSYPVIRRISKLAAGLNGNVDKLAAYEQAAQVVTACIEALDPEQRTIIQGYIDGEKISVLRNATSLYSNSTFYEHQLKACLIFAESLDILAAAANVSRAIIPPLTSGEAPATEQRAQDCAG